MPLAQGKTTALHYAAVFGNKAVLRKLIGAGASSFTLKNNVSGRAKRGGGGFPQASLCMLSFRQSGYTPADLARRYNYREAAALLDEVCATSLLSAVQ